MLLPQRAEASGFIGQLTDLQGRTGFDWVGERGVKLLSGGQRASVLRLRSGDAERRRFCCWTRLPARWTPGGSGDSKQPKHLMEAKP
jgi:hypothetical protein